MDSRWAYKSLQRQSSKLIYKRDIESPRTAILVNKNVNCIPIPDFIQRDLVSAIFEVPTECGTREIVIASAYFPGDADEAPPEAVTNLVSYCKSNNLQFIIGCDANAHHTLWGSTNINRRGQMLLEYLSSSSHILFELPGQILHKNSPAARKCINWEIFRLSLTSKEDQLLNSISHIDELELAADQINSVISQAHEDACKVEPRTSRRDVPWWNSRLEEMRREVRKLFNSAKRSGVWVDYKTSLTAYNNEIRKSKRKSWKTFCDSVDNTPQMARLHKVLRKSHSNDIGLLKKSDGLYTTNGREILQHLLHVHFPGSILCDASIDRRTLSYEQPDNQLRSLSGIIFGIDKIRWAVNSFSPFKLPGSDGIFPAYTFNLRLRLVRFD
ncbi:uncharacterized protein LOC119666005 [Teleopsis dalmanni]|uniref:uncharacterized protein LOC119666005 n=1 Tax=Teleopsis dalmanni TaxID=139649 RepID=UPI0018CE7315|nr:uncharacterized protein LOC119666005 [Teleopsis dalmanni]